MPCYDGRGPNDDYDAEQRNKQQRKLDKLTRMLCALCRLTPPQRIKEVPDLEKWWREHEKFDRLRKK